MKKFAAIFLVMAIAVAILWPKKPTANSLKDRETSSPISKNKKLFLGKRTPIITTATSSQCSQLSNALSEIDFNSSLEEVMAGLGKEKFSSCVHPEFGDKILAVQNACFGDVIQDSCQSDLIFIRALLRTETATEPYDQATMADLILREFSKKAPDFKKLNQLVEELLGRDPRNQNFQRLWATSKLMANADRKQFPKNLKEEIYERLDPEVVNQENFQSFKLFLESEMNPVKAENFAREYVDNFPKSPMSHEILGWSLWVQNKRGEALKQLEQAIGLNPKDEWLKQMYQKLKSPDAKQEDYQGRMQLGIGLEDLYN